MNGQESRGGLLIMRVDRQEAYLLITVTIERSLSDRPIGTPPSEQYRVTDPADALQIVADFLASCRPA